jgi:hypothetical protein
MTVRHKSTAFRVGRKALSIQPAADYTDRIVDDALPALREILNDR